MLVWRGAPSPAPVLVVEIVSRLGCSYLAQRSVATQIPVATSRN